MWDRRRNEDEKLHRNARVAQISVCVFTRRICVLGCVTANNKTGDSVPNESHTATNFGLCLLQRPHPTPSRIHIYLQENNAASREWETPGRSLDPIVGISSENFEKDER